MSQLSSTEAVIYVLQQTRPGQKLDGFRFVEAHSNPNGTLRLAFLTPYSSFWLNLDGASYNRDELQAKAWIMSQCGWLRRANQEARERKEARDAER